MAMPGFMQRMRDAMYPPSRKQAILGLFQDAESAATAGDALKEAGVPDTDYDFLTDSPYPEGALGEREEKHRLYLYPFIGALLGLSSGIMITAMTRWPTRWLREASRCCPCPPWPSSATKAPCWERDPVHRHRHRL